MPNYSSKHYAEVSRRYAEGTPQEVQALGAEKSAKDYNTEAKRYAEEAQTLLEGTLNETQISNCITEIPQDIKLELADGVLTLKAGSKVYVPNGFESDGTTPKFDEVVVESDITVFSFNGNITVYQFYSADNNIAYSRTDAQVFSGSTAPTSTTYMIWYDTTNNVIKVTSDAGATWRTEGWSLPISRAITTSDGVYTSIKQIFNGFGYVGSTVFALPGVKGLIPNGRNADGTLRNIEFTLNSVRTATRTSSYTGGLYFVLGSSWVALSASNYYRYDEKINYNVDSNGISFGCICCSIYCSGTTLSDFQPKTTFHAVDYNDAVKYSDKATVVGWSIPNRANAVSVSTGALYTAPSNGWLYVNITGQRSTNEKIVITIGGIQYSYGRSLYDNQYEDITAEILVSRGDVCAFTVTGTWTVKFIPCK